MIELNKIYNEDCLIGMKDIPDKSVDCIICDLPYGTTSLKWDTVIPFEPLWAQYKRIIKDNGAIVLFGSQPFTSALVMSNVKWFKYQFIWDKKQSGNFQLAKYQPLKVHEDICIFGNGRVNYYPIMEDADISKNRPNKKEMGNTTGLKHLSSGVYSYSENRDETKRFPKSILQYHARNGECNSLNRVHPTQKPVALLEYLIKTYTNEGETVLDNCMGSGTTAIACMNTNRNFIGFELNKEYYDIANRRIEENKMKLF
jgi:site-specific DNA-methyltransferase (adenine-specific)